MRVLGASHEVKVLGASHEVFSMDFSLISLLERSRVIQRRFEKVLGGPLETHFLMYPRAQVTSPYPNHRDLLVTTPMVTTPLYSGSQVGNP